MKDIKKYVPAILTGTAIATHVTSNILFVRAAKKESKDGKKSHYILPSVFSGLSIATIIFSDRYNTKEKAGLIALLAASNASSYKLEQEARKKYGDEAVDNLKMDVDSEGVDFERMMIEADALEDEDAGVKIDRRYYYFPQCRKIVSCTPDELTAALLNINNVFRESGAVSVSEFFDAIDINIVDSDPDPFWQHDGYRFGWVGYDPDPSFGETDINTNQYTRTLPSGKDVTYVYFISQPLRFDEWDEYYNTLYERMKDEYEEKNCDYKDTL